MLVSGRVEREVFIEARACFLLAPSSAPGLRLAAPCGTEGMRRHRSINRTGIDRFPFIQPSGPSERTPKR
jgi:hypothetical protein